MKSQYRHLTLRHEQRILNGITPKLKPGEAAFHSFYLPSLGGGLHTITVNQTIDAKERGTKTAIPVLQQFNVIAPRFNLPPEIFDSVYPPPGHTALPKTLPHIVLKDPHFPWERDGSDKPSSDIKNTVPWVALIAFTADELQLQEAEAAQIFGSEARPNDSLGYDMKVLSVRDIQHPDVTNQIPIPDLREEKDTMYTSVIPLGAELFKHLFTDGAGNGDISRYRFMSHVREVATDGMVSDGDEDAGMYSIVLSHRLGPLEVTAPTPVMVHLVSLEGLESIKADDIKKRVLVTSLYSWSYTSLPPDSFDVKSALEKLGTGGLTIFRTSTLPNDRPGPGDKSLESIITRRQNDGYSIVRHRTITGEETASIYRGPLVPNPVAHPLPNMPSEAGMQSNFGSDLQILDPDLSLMDISYSTAWQLGKTLAMGDQSFAAALSRLRGTIHAQALGRAKEDIDKKAGTHSSRESTIAGISEMVAGLRDINSQLHVDKTVATSINRWKRPTMESIDTSLHSPHILSQIYGHAKEAAHTVSLATDGQKADYHKVPSNTDYAVVQDWILDKLHLAGVPVHYLIPDPSYLPKESLRFFHIDENWTDALVDGALSLANHWGAKPNEDHCRTALKEAINDYLAKPRQDLGYCQQMPKYGFFLRTEVLSKFPDLTVKATFANTLHQWEEENAKPKAPILVQRKLESDTMLCLFDRMPPELKSLEFMLPAHQQCFTVASSLSESQIEIAHKRIYTGKTPETDQEVRRTALFESKYPTPSVLDWNWRTIKTEAYTKLIWDVLDAKMLDKTKFTETAMTSAIFAVQLNEPIYTLRIEAPATNSLTTWSEEIINAHAPFQFHVPPYPSHQHRPGPLPIPVSRPSIARTKLNRPVTLTNIIPSPQPTLQKSKTNTTTPPDVLVAPPRFEFGVYPVGYKDAAVPTNTGLPMDLVVSLVMPWSYNYTLLNITVKIECGDVKDKFDPILEYRPLISREYECPPPTMLSNLRFNVLKKWEKDVLVLEVVPRKREGFNFQKVKEASFLLSMVPVLQWPDKEVKAYVNVAVTCEEKQASGSYSEEVFMKPGTVGGEADVEEESGGSGDEWEVLDGRRMPLLQARRG
ncbi:hypothetical protein B0T17DRAFT_497463 [Bombardia bombarda]|uniref:Uncharacterized protein n=1 Tax=Bombardia bombarda TaxID=252184 RepID=A0AA39WHN6_9PEZI|nr:hypothetical protein B0T17DRAFT_497463 [Bombardia bombarda]